VAIAARLLIFILFAYTTSLQGMRILWEWKNLTGPASQTEAFAEFESKVASLRADLPSRGRIRLVTVPPNLDRSLWIYYTVQYTLAPLLVLNSGLPAGRCVVVAATGEQLDALLLRFNWRVVRRASPNIVLVDSSEQEKSEEPRMKAESAPQ
jgi:hypothetical protein